MTRRRGAILLWIVCGCTKTEPTTGQQAKTEVVATVEPEAPRLADALDVGPPTFEHTPADEPIEDDEEPETTGTDATPEAAAPEVELASFSAIPHTVPWQLVTEHEAGLALVDLGAGVLARVGDDWYQRGTTDELVPVTMDRQPEGHVMGVWPSDAWFIQQRTMADDPGDMGLIEVRLMKLRNGKRWVPQPYRGDQWFHPGTDEWSGATMSVRSGMLVRTSYGATRVAGKHDDVSVGPHRGELLDFLETGSGKVYVLSIGDGGIWAQVECEDEACVKQHATRLPSETWAFGRRIARGRFSVSVVASKRDPAGGRTYFLLHHRGRSGGWLLEELPFEPTGLWPSKEGGLWMLTAKQVLRRDTESVWREIALPEPLEGPSLAITESLEQVWLAGESDGKTKVFVTDAIAERVHEGTAAP